MKYFSQYKAFIMHLLAPLGGPWAVLVLTTVDAAMFGIPVDPVVAYYAYTDRSRMGLYILLASIGSAVGSLFPYGLGYKGGEGFVVNRVGRQSFERVHRRVERHGIWALIISAIMPPPTPFKLFIFCAGVAKMSWMRLAGSIFVGRLMRFTLLSVLTVLLGPNVVDTFNNITYRHREIAVLVAAVVAALIILVLVRQRRTHLNADLRWERDQDRNGRGRRPIEQPRHGIGTSVEACRFRP